MTHQIEKAGFEDFSQLSAIFAGDSPSGQGPPTTETIVGGLWRGAVYKATVNGRVAGAVILGEDSDADTGPWCNESCVLKIKHFVIGSEFQGLAVGRRLLEFVEAQAVEHGFSQVSAQIGSGNAVAMWLLRRFGYIKSGLADSSATNTPRLYEKKFIPAIQGELACV